MNEESRELSSSTSPSAVMAEIHVGKTVRGTKREDLETCFWLGREGAPPPQPVKGGGEEVYLKFDPKATSVYVRRFRGWALSREDWIRERKALMEDLKARIAGASRRGVCKCG